MSVLNAPLVAQTNDNTNHLLAEGQYPAVVAGLLVQSLQKYTEDKSAPVEFENKLSIVWQVHGEAHQAEDDEAEPTPLIRYIKSVPYKISTNQKAGLMKMLMAWSKCNTPAEVIEKLADATTGEMQLSILVGKCGLLTLTHKTVNDKTYPEIVTVGTPKKSQAVEFAVAEGIPDYLHNPKVVALESLWVNGATFLEAKKAEGALPAAPVTTNQVTKEEDDSLPF